MANAAQANLSELIQQFLVEVGQYLAYWNLYAMAAKNAKPTRRRWQGGTVITKPNQAQLDEMMQLHGEHLDWGVKLNKTGEILAGLLITSGFRRDAKRVLKINHRARGGGGGAEKVFPIWEPIKISLQAAALQYQSRSNQRTAMAAKKGRGRPIKAFTTQRREFAEPLRENGLSWGEILELYKKAHRTDREATVDSLRCSCNRRKSS